MDTLNTRASIARDPQQQTPQFRHPTYQICNIQITHGTLPKNPNPVPAKYSPGPQKTPLGALIKTLLSIYSWVFFIKKIKHTILNEPLEPTRTEARQSLACDQELLHIPCTKGVVFRVQGSGFRVQGSGFRVQGSGFRV